LLVYQFDVLTTQRMIAASLEEVPAYDPITGEAIRMVDPKLVPQKVTVVQTISLLLRDGQLQSWSRQLGEQRSFN
ncbi:MAG TPA: hypothetical protein VHN79_04390, partial [Lacunisphaera sp.]|nr:hypothetical protein [Lacunisphaera sp.]